MKSYRLSMLRLARMISVVLVAAAMWRVASSSYEHAIIRDSLGYLTAGETLLHTLPPSRFSSYRMPLAGVVAAGLFSHRVVPARLNDLLAAVAPLLLVFCVGCLLQPASCLLPALALHFLLSGPWPRYPESGLALLLLLAAGAMIWRAQRPGRTTALLVAAAVGASLLFRSTLALLPPLLALAERWGAKGKVSRVEQLIMLVVPYLFLLPWLWLNWTVHHRVTPFEHGAADSNIVAAALGGEQATLADLPQRLLPSLNSDRPLELYGWALARIAAHPLPYLQGFFLRLGSVLASRPLLLLASFTALVLLRRRKDFQALGLLVVYFLFVHCLMAVEVRYFEPLWPLASLLAAGLAAYPWTQAPRPGPRVHRAAVKAVQSALGLVLGLCLYTEGLVLEYASASAYIDKGKALESHPQDAWLLGESARRRLERGDAAGGAADLRAALARPPRDPELERLLIWSLARQGEPDALRDLPTLDAHVLAAVSLLKEGKASEAEAHIRAAVEEHAQPLRALRSALAAPGQGESCDPRFSRDWLARLGPEPERDRLAFQGALAALFPDCVPYALQLAGLYSEAGDYKRSARLLETLSLRRPLEARRWIERLPQEAGTLRRSAGADRERRRYGPYRTAATALLKLYPDDAELWLDLASTARQVGDRATALQAAARVESLTRDPGALRRIAELYRTFQESRRALAIVGPLLVRSTREPGLWILQAESALEEGRQDLARASLARAEALAPSEDDRLRLVRAYAGLKDYPRALAALEPLLKASPGEAGLWCERAEIALRADDRSSALESLTRAQGLEPRGPDLRRMARAYARLREYSRARGILERLLAAAPRDAGLWVERAELARLAGEPALALDCLARARAAAPGDEERHRIALIYQSLKAYGPAVEMLEALAGDQPERAAYLGDLGLCRYLGGDAAAALADLTRAVELDRDALAAYLTLGAILTERGRFADALALYEKGLARPAAQGSRPLRELLRQSRDQLKGR